MESIAALFRRARKLGHFVHSPLLQHWTFADADAEVNDGQYWLDLSVSMLELLSTDSGGVEIWLVKFPGWDSSSGVARELEIAQQLGIPVMILLLGWNVAGAAIATVIGNILSAVFYVSHLLSKKSQLSIRLQDYKAGDKIAGSVFAIGIPASLNSVLMSVSNIFINNLMAHYGDMAVAGLGVAMKVNMIVVMLLIGLGTGIQPLLGYCFGAGNRKRYFAVLKFSILLAFVLSAIMTCVCYFGADGLVSAFLEDADAYDFGFQFSRIYILSGPILGQLFVFINAIQSTGAALPSLILSISRQGLLYLPILFIINATTDSARLLALAQPVTDYLATALAIILFVITCKKYFPKKSSIE
jgi:Na+-driven multidrug efflux pump